MKKIFLITILFFISKLSFSQIIQSRPSGMFLSQTGGSNNWYQMNGVGYTVAGLVLSEFSDTSSANSNAYIKNIAGCLIRVSNKIYFRSVALNSWIEISTGGGSAWSLTGNAGTAPATNFIGTTGAQNFTLRVNNIYSGGIDRAGGTFLGYQVNHANPYVNSQNTGIGFKSLFSADPSGGGDGNVGIGVFSLFANTIGGSNVGIGVSSLASNIDGSFNVGIGESSLTSNASGNYSTAVGASSLFSNLGNLNVAVGYSSMYYNTTGEQNTAIGASSLVHNTTGTKNFAGGAGVLEANTTGSFNTITGVDGGLHITTGSGNNGSGWNVFSALTTGSNNNGTGYLGGGSITTGSFNSFFGRESGYNASQKINADSSIALGAFSYNTKSRQAVIGGNYITETILRGALIDSSLGTATSANTLYYNTTNGFVTYGAAPTTTSLPISSLTAATGTNSIDNTDKIQTWDWSTFAGAGSIGALNITTTSGSGAQQVIMNVAGSGANSGASRTTISGQFQNTHTGTTSTNIAGFFTASGGTNNYGIIVPSGGGNVGIGTSGPAYLLDVTRAGGSVFTGLFTNTSGGPALGVAGTSTSSSATVFQVLGGSSAATSLFDVRANGDIIAPLLSSAVGTKAVRWNGSTGKFSVADTTSGGGSSGITVGTTTITSGTSTRVPFNDGGVYGEDAGLTFNKTTDALSIAGDIINPDITISGLGGVTRIKSSGTIQWYNPGVSNSMQSWLKSDASEGFTLNTTDNSFNSYTGTGAINIQNGTGKVAVGSGTATAKLHVFGTELVTGAVQFSNYAAGAATFDGSGNITSVSDRRMKHNIKPFTYGLSEIIRLKTSTFIYNQDASNTVMSGFIAQDVQGVMPTAVHEKNGVLSLETNAILAASVNAIRELNGRVDKLEKENKELKAKLKKQK